MQDINIYIKNVYLFKIISTISILHDYIARLKNPREHSPKSMPVCPHCR